MKRRFHEVFNHYAYGAVVDWMYRNVAGLAPESADPGYRSVIVAPRPATAVTWARASIEIRLGHLAIDWRIDSNGSLVIELDVPFGAHARLDAPLTASSTVSVNGQASDAITELEHGHHTIVVTSPAIASA